MANPMYWNGYIEKVGSGTEDMVARCINYGLKKPEFIQDANFQVTIWRSVANEADTDIESREKSREKILSSIAENSKVTTNELSIIVGISVKGVEKHLKKLQADGFLRRVGGRKEGHWEIIPAKNNDKDNK